MRGVVRFVTALGVAVLVWPVMGFNLSNGTYMIPKPTELEVSFHGNCSGPLTYLECLAGGRHNSPMSQYLGIERHRTYARLTVDDLNEIAAHHYNYICDKPELCVS